MQNTQKDLAVIIGGYLSELRKDVGLTQQQIADNLHLSKSSISHFEQGISIPTTLILIALADYFDVNVDYLIGANINQICRRINSTGRMYSEDAQELKERQEEIWRLLKSSLSEEP